MSERDWMDPQCRKVLLDTLGQEEVDKIDALYDRIAEGQEIRNDVLWPWLERQPDLHGGSQMAHEEFAEWWKDLDELSKLG